MARRAARRGRLVLLLLGMTRQAARAIVARPRLVRRVARRAICVLRDLVQAKTLVRRMARDARRRFRDTVWSMRPVARLAVLLPVLALALVDMTARAGGRLQRRVRLVTARALRVTLRRTRRFGGVARRARRLRRGRCVDVLVAIRACGVPAAPARLVGVTGGARGYLLARRVRGGRVTRDA